MTPDIIFHDPEEIIKEISEKIKSNKIIFFIGSAVSYRKPSKLPSVLEIQENTIQALCKDNALFKDPEKYFDSIFSYDELREKKETKIKHEEFIELIYKTVVDGKIAIHILDCLKEGKPNKNHFFLAECLVTYCNTILTTNQDVLIEKALEEIFIEKRFEKCWQLPPQKTPEGDVVFEKCKIIKLHGCVERQESIITLLRQLISGLPENRSVVLRTHLKNNCLLFTGYSGQDEDIFRVLISADWKKIYWNVKPGSKVSENVKKLYRKYPDKFCLFEYNLDDLFDKLTGELKVEQHETDEASDSNLQENFNGWAENLGIQKSNVLGGILSNDRVAKYAEALECFEQTLNAASDKKSVLAKTYYLLGGSYMDFKTYEVNNNYECAYKTYSKAADSYSDLNDIEGKANALVGMGESCRHRTRYKEAVNFYQEALEIDIKNKGISAKARYHLADVYRMQDMYEDAIKEYHQACEIFNECGFIANVAYCLIWLGEVYVYKGDYVKALEYNSLARRISKKYNFEQYLAWAKYVEADINKYKGSGMMKDWDEDKEEKLNKIVEYLDDKFKNMKNRLGQAWCNQMLAELCRLEEDCKNAQTINNKGVEYCGRDGIDYKICLAYLMLNEGEILRAKNQYDAAIGSFNQVCEIDVGDLKRHKAHAHLGIAETNRMKGVGSSEEYEKALNMYRKIGMRHGIVHALIGLALFTGLIFENPLPIIKEAKEESLKEPSLKKELMFIENMEHDILKNKKDIFKQLHPLEFP